MTSPQPQQNSWELQCLLEIFVKLDPKHVLEIGSCDGGTLQHWVGAGRHVGSIDLQGMPEWQNFCQAHGVSSFVGDSHSEEAFKWAYAEFPSGVDWLFIDGDHTYDGVRADWANYGLLLNDGGAAIFHDIYADHDPNIGVSSFWEEFKAGAHDDRMLHIAEIVDHQGKDPRVAEFGLLGLGIVYL